MADFDAADAGAGPSRRSVVAGGLGGLTAAVLGSSLVSSLSGCSVASPTSPEKARPPAGQPTPDVAIAARALAEVRVLRQAVTGTISRFPATRSQLSAVVTMHRAHESSLVDAVPDRVTPTRAPAPYVVPRKRRVALRSLESRERALHDTLDGLALRAESGEFARLLASMGAAVHQRLAGWPQ